MNIFVLHHDPRLAASNCCDQHVSKMHTESVQMIVANMIHYGIDHGVLTLSGNLHKGGHPNHPCTRWVRESSGNVRWLVEHASALCNQHFLRFGRTPYSREQLNGLRRGGKLAELIEKVFDDTRKSRPTPFVQCMPDEFKDPCTVTAYRNFYNGAKAKFARYNKSVPAPPWFSPEKCLTA